MEQYNYISLNHLEFDLNEITFVESAKLVMIRAKLISVLSDATLYIILKKFNGLEETMECKNTDMEI